MRRVIFLLIISGAGLAILIGLGTWQLQRKAWKEGILATIEARIADESADHLPQALDQEADKYRPVRLTGDIGAEELHVLTSIKDIGPGYRVISPFTLEDGRRVLVDRGFIPVKEKQAARISGPATIEGNIHWPQETDSYTPAPDLAGNIWYARNTGRMADHLGTEPVMIVLRASPEGEAGLRPVPVSTSGIPNDHLQYAITWFSLALIWAAMTLYFLRRSRP
ncbi:SURF1 family protein [Leisingera daeponensis]|uniref:SURF1-like protein n=1 Tax=Leisingera daeponensis TaxID=405746 RepID=A0ABS7NDX4_9RHOB|nr:SURF1 family protein [Leisingera daeponensis]MBY6056870.1 SURF1 family protein [Leisingera daeponensis]MBY6139397.1 SURF1 family protein [Leisingera daeponensis]